MNPIACMALTAGLLQPSVGDTASDDLCATVDIDIAGAARVVGPDAPISRRVDLTRLRAETGLTFGWAGARVAVVGARSTPEDGYVGVAGEAFVPVVQIAEARAAWSRIGLTAFAGLIDEPWVLAENQTWGYRPIGVTGVEVSGLLPRSDAGLGLAWGAPDNRVRVTATALSGEGANQRERNDGQSVAIMVDIHPLDSNNLTVSIMAREGSLGLASARDHRLGARMDGGTAALRGGVSVLHGAGLLGDGSRRPTTAAAWVVTEPGEWFATMLRYELYSEPIDDATSHRLLAATGLRPRNANRPFEAWLTASWAEQGAALAPVPDVSVSSWSVGVQLGVRARHTLTLNSLVVESP